MAKGGNMMAMADVQRKSWQTKARTANIALPYYDIDTSQKFITLRHRMSILTMASKNLNWSLLMT